MAGPIIYTIVRVTQFFEFIRRIADYRTASSASRSRPAPRSDGTTDLYITSERSHEQFCPDVPAPQAARMAATQRPATQEALTEESGERPLWREVPSWVLIGQEDRNIPAAVQRYMAERAGARQAVEIPGASHALTVSRPEETAQLIVEAAKVGVPAGMAGTMHGGAPGGAPPIVPQLPIIRTRTEGEQRATFFELFFDLVYVFAVTQLSHHLLADITWSGAAETALMLVALYWAWNYTTWMTNWFSTRTPFRSGLCWCS